MYRTDFWTLWEKARVGCFERTASKHVYYLGWNRSAAQFGCMRQVLGPGVLGRPRGIGWRGRWEGGSGWGMHVYPRLIHVNVWQEPLQYCKVIGLQLIKIYIFKKSQKIKINKEIKLKQNKTENLRELVMDRWESQVPGKLIRSLGVPMEREVWSSQGGIKDKLFFFFSSTFLRII